MVNYFRLRFLVKTTNQFGIEHRSRKLSVPKESRVVCRHESSWSGDSLEPCSDFVEHSRIFQFKLSDVLRYFYFKLFFMGTRPAGQNDYDY